MKKKFLFFILFLSLFLMSPKFSYSTNLQNEWVYNKKNYIASIGVNPIGLLLGVLNADVDFYTVNLAPGLYPSGQVSYFHYSSGGWDANGFGIMAGVKKYFDPGLKGFYLKGFLGIIYLSADYSYYFAGVSSSTSGSVTGFAIGGEVGYKWVFGTNNNWFVSLEGGIDCIFNGEINVTVKNQYTVGGYTYTSTYTETFDTFNGLVPVGGLTIGLMF